MHCSWHSILLCLAAGGLVDGLSVDFDSSSSIYTASSTIVYDLLSTYYFGNQTGNNPGNLVQPPYYWWEAGAMFMHLVDYYYYTGDASNNPAVEQAITWQAGTDGLFMPSNQTEDEGNDDQVFWAFASMSAAELNFPKSSQYSTYPSYAAMSQAVFNIQTTRWDPENCGGGLRWQINPLNNGYDYKNLAANGGFFQLASRLARYTGNATYVHWAEKMWDWLDASVLIDSSDPTNIKVYDGAAIGNNCSEATESQYSYNYGLLIGGLAYIYNHTQDDKWMTPLTGIVNGLLSAFAAQDDILIEAGCEPENNCNTDGLTFKSFTVRWLAIATQLVPSLKAQVQPYLAASATGAAGQCDGGSSGSFCGYHWTTTTWDGSQGVGQQISALSAINAPLIALNNLPAPLTLDTGAKSKQNPSAGTTTGGDTNPLAKITTSDRAGAWIVTLLILAALAGGTFWLLAVPTE